LPEDVTLGSDECVLTRSLEVICPADPESIKARIWADVNPVDKGEKDEV
jgi:hypothetical protein